MQRDKPNRHVVSASALIPARRERVYSLLANYRDGHPRIVPRQITDIVVEQGGIGAGTIIRFQLSVLGKRQTIRAAITEPEPGRVLVETGLDGNEGVTTFTVDPAAAAGDCTVTISTELKVRSGCRGWIEKTLSTWLLRPMYEQELANLSRVATGPFGG